MEILISTAVFLIVLFVAVVSLINMNKNNNKLIDLNISGTCAKQLEENIINNIILADRSMDSVWGLELGENGLVMKNIVEIPGKAGDFTGIATSSSTATGSIRVRAVYKENTIYKYAETEIDKQGQVKDGEKVSNLFKEADPKKFFDCMASDATNIFSIKMAPKYRAPSKNNFDIELNDLIYNRKNKLVFSRAYLHEFKIYE
jgi:hypothetical protein